MSKSTFKMPDWMHKTNDPALAQRMRRQGMPVQLLTPEEAEEVPFVMCGLGTKSPFVPLSMILRGVCADCRACIYWRKTMPQKPPKVCARCAFKRSGIAITAEVQKILKKIG